MVEESESDSGITKAEEDEDRPAPEGERPGPRGKHPDRDGEHPDRDGEPQDAGDGAPDGDSEPKDVDGEPPDAGSGPPAGGGNRPDHALDRPVDEYDSVGDGEPGSGPGPGDGPYGPEGPPDDEEMPLTEHIEEMVLRLAAVLAIAGLVTAVAFPFAQEPITFIWYNLLPRTVEAGGEVISTQPRVYGPLELKLMELKLASLAGLVAALPMGVYQSYRFMRPGLYPHERRYYLAAVPTSLVLAFIGLAFAFFVVLPAIFTYFLYYSENAGEIAFALQQTFNLIIILEAFMAMVFQIPLLIMLAIMMGVTTRRWLQDRRLYFWAGFMGIAFIFSPDPTGMAPLLVAATMVVLFEGTLALLRWTGN